MADAIPTNAGKSSEPEEKRNTAKQIRRRPGFPGPRPAVAKKKKGKAKKTARPPRERNETPPKKAKKGQNSGE